MAYVLIEKSQVPSHIRFEVRGCDAGQIVEVAHATNADVWRRNSKGEIRCIPRYRHTVDRSDNTEIYEQLEGHDVEVDLICKAFASERNRRKHVLTINDVTGQVRVYDNVAGHYTTCHSLSARDLTRARKAACPVAL